MAFGKSPYNCGELPCGKFCMGNMHILVWPCSCGDGVKKNPSKLQRFPLVSFSASYGRSKFNETVVVDDLSLHMIGSSLHMIGISF